jgi:hypothetical protein
MSDFLEFRTMVVPNVIRALWLLATVVCVGMALLVSVANPGGMGPLPGLFLLFVGPVVLRIVAELVMLLFRIYEVLVEIRDMLAESGRA